MDKLLIFINCSEDSLNVFSVLFKPSKGCISSFTLH